MKQFLEPRNVAVIGASRDAGKVGNAIFANLLKSSVKVFPINPNADEVLGVRAYASVLEVPVILDMAVIVVPAKLVPQVLKDCGEARIKSVIVVSAGFSESGNNELQEQIKKIAEHYKISVLGPNVLGVVNPYKNLNASFFNGMPKTGSVGFISQSGAVGTSILDKALEIGLGVSAFIPLGNMMQQDFISALEYFKDDRRTNVIGFYIESLKEGTGKKFVELCREISKTKKIIVLKSGKTKQGSNAAKTHTASMSSDAEIYSGAFEQTGVIEVNKLEEMVKLAEVFEKFGKLGKRVGIISNAGGLGVLAVDALVKAGFEIPEIPEKVLRQLDEYVPTGYSRANPLDILGDALAERYEKALRILKMYNLFDFYVVIISPQQMTQALETSRVLSGYKNVIPCFIGGKSFKQAEEFLKEKNVVSFDDVGDLRILRNALEKN